MDISNRAELLDHPALLYGSLEGFIRVVAPYIAAGLDNDEAVFVTARGDYLGPLRDAIGSQADRAIWTDTLDWHPHPARRLRAFHDFVIERLQDGATNVCLAGEPLWPTGAPEMVQEWQRYESVLNRVLAPYPVTLMCLYDAATLEPELLHAALMTHRLVHRDAARYVSEHFEDPEDLLPRWTPPAESPPAWAPGVELADAAAGRRLLEVEALEAGIDEERSMELCLAANEILTNAFVHARGATLHAWTEGDRFICQVDDEGDGIEDSLAGYRPPAEDREGGRGIWIARQLVDLLQISRSPSGASVRLHMNRRAVL